MLDITLKSRDGGNFSAYLSLPESDMKSPAVVVIQEIFGVNDNMRMICDHLSAAGFIAICPDLFWRQEPNVRLTDKSEGDWKRAFELYQGFNIDLGIDDLKATLNFIRMHEACTGRVGTMGYCLGGKLAYLMACRSTAECNVSYYGVGIDADLSEAKNIKNPLLMHIAEKDKFVPAAAREKIIEALDAMPATETHVYLGQDHAFARKGGDHFNAEAAQTANMRTADFLATHLAVFDRE